MRRTRTRAQGLCLGVAAACALTACRERADDATGVAAQGLRVGPEVRALSTADTGAPTPLLYLARYASARSAVASSPSGYLVAWKDQRFWTSGDLHVARVNVDGRVLDVGGIPLTGDDWGEALFYGDQDPQVVWTGVSYAVLWYKQSASGVVARRVSTTGAILDPAPVLVASGVDAFVAKMDGADLVVAGTATSGSGTTLALRRVSPTDLSTRSQWSHPVTGLSSGAGVGFKDLAASASGYLALFQDGDVLGWRFARDGSPIDAAPRRLTVSLAQRGGASAASDGTNYLVSLRAGAPAGARPAGFYALLLDPSLAPVGPALTYLGPLPALVGVGATVNARGTSAIWDGRTFAVAMDRWSLARVDAAGNRVGPEVAGSPDANYDAPSVAGAAGQALVVAGQDAPGSGYALLAQRFVDGAAGPSPATPLPPFEAGLPVLGWNGQRVLAATSGRTAGQYVTRFLPDLTPQDATPITALTTRARASVSVSAQTFLVSTGAESITVGSTGGASAIVTTTNHAATAFRSDGRIGLSALCPGPGGATTRSVRRVDGTGRELDPAAIEIPGASNSCGALPTHDGRNFVVLYSSSSSSPGCPGATLRFERFSEEGDPLDLEGVPVACASAPLALASAGATHLAVWNIGGTPNLLRAARFRSSDGALLDATPLALGAHTGGGIVGAAFDGTDFVVFWSGTGTSTLDGRVGRGIRGARVGLDGTLRDPGGVIVVDDPMVGLDVTAASDGAGTTWIGYVRNTAPTSGWYGFIRAVDLRGSAGADAGTDVGVALDAGADARIDAVIDARLDAGADAGTDAGDVVIPDVGVDASSDARMDAVDVAPSDSAADAASDRGVIADDVSPDAAPDTASDDAATDATARDVVADVADAPATDASAPAPPAPGCAQCNVGAAPSTRGVNRYALLGLALFARRRRSQPREPAPAPRFAK